MGHNSEMGHKSHTQDAREDMRKIRGTFLINAICYLNLRHPTELVYAGLIKSIHYKKSLRTRAFPEALATKEEAIFWSKLWRTYKIN